MKSRKSNIHMSHAVNPRKFKNQLYDTMSLSDFHNGSLMSVFRRSILGP